MPGLSQTATALAVKRKDGINCSRGRAKPCSHSCLRAEPARGQAELKSFTCAGHEAVG